MRYIAALLFAVSLAACGGDDEPEVLRMRGLDISPENYRTQIRLGMANEPAGWSSLCRQLKDLSLKEADDLLNAVAAESRSVSTTTATVPPNATPRPGQTPDASSQLGATKIIQQECDRTF
jgi:hypothetical protein